MFSSDLTKIRLAELKAKGTSGDVARLRSCCLDAAAIFKHAANILDGKPLPKAKRSMLASDLRRGASHLRAMSGLTAPKMKRVAKGGK